MPAQITASFPGVPAAAAAAPILAPGAGAVGQATSGVATSFGALMMTQGSAAEVPPVQLAAGFTQNKSLSGALPEAAVVPEPVVVPAPAVPATSALSMAAAAVPAENAVFPAQAQFKPLPLAAVVEQEAAPSLPVMQAPAAEPAMRPVTAPPADRKPFADTSANERDPAEEELASQQAMAPQPSLLPVPLVTAQTVSPPQATEPMQEDTPAALRDTGVAVVSTKTPVKTVQGAMAFSKAEEQMASEKALDLASTPALTHPRSPFPAQSALSDNGAAIGRDNGDRGLPSPLLTQTLAPVPVASPPVGSPYPSATQAIVHAPVVQAEPGRMGADIGLQIAKAAKGEREDLLIRLDPRELGRIDVRLSFDRDGMLRAVLSADSPNALDLLRRESGDLNRALTDAGIRADGQSLRFDARSGDQGSGSGHGAQRNHLAQGSGSDPHDEGVGNLADLTYQPLRTSGHVDLMA